MIAITTVKLIDWFLDDAGFYLKGFFNRLY